LARVYTFETYWHVRQRLKGQPAIEHRAPSDRADGRVDYWVKLINRFAPGRNRVIEVGCGHGVLLEELNDLGYQCIGVEPDERTAAWVRDRSGIDVRSGFFPQVQLPACDLFLAFDVLEHSPEPEAFMHGAADLLDGGGVAIVQTPIDRYGDQPPFGPRFRSAFDDVEHLFLFTDKAMEELARRCGLVVLDATQRLWLHHEICVFGKA
jgi:2-polyprenyl-3-methyl-5-hydroxy-6-metoxy-1,4-benzoquinol methylase